MCLDKFIYSIEKWILSTYFKISFQIYKGQKYLCIARSLFHSLAGGNNTMIGCFSP